MQQSQASQEPLVEALDDAALVSLAQQGSASAFRQIMQRHNRRLYRVARAVLRDDSDAEDAVQEAYLRAFTHLTEFRGGSSLSTWLTRIVLNEALGRLRRRRCAVGIEVLDAAEASGGARILHFPGLNRDEHDPERAAARREIRRLLERTIDALPEPFRVVFMMRVVEEMSVEETASHLGLRPETVKTRLHRARRLLRRAVDAELAPALTDSFPFAGARCARITQAVLDRLGRSLSPPPE